MQTIYPHPEIVFSVVEGTTSGLTIYIYEISIYENIIWHFGEEFCILESYTKNKIIAYQARNLEPNFRPN